VSKVGDEVLAEFYGRLEKTKDVDETMVARLKSLLASGKKTKANDLVAVFKQDQERQLP
jgi:hypothetical protein